MADYYPLIAKAVTTLSPNTGEARQAIYERARTALTRQLASIDPPPGAAIVDRELGALEAVIRRIEAENAAAPASVAAGLDPDPAIETAMPAEEAPRPPSIARPQAPVRAPRKPTRKPLYAVAGALGLVAVTAIATLAILRRNEPPAVSSQRIATPAAPQPPRPAQTTKTEDRVTPGTPEAAPNPAIPRPSAPQAPTTSSPPTPPPVTAPQQPPAQPAIAVANRLVMAMEGVERPETVVVRQGAVVWRTEMISGTQGQPPQLAIKAMLEVPDARMRGEMTIQRNRDPAFPASHTIQVQFTPGTGSEYGTVRNLAQIELRQSENQAGYPLSGQGIAVTENLFLLALAQFEPALSRNIEMMRARPIIYLEFQNATGRRGAMVLEKGISGQQAFDEAFRNWQ